MAAPVFANRLDAGLEEREESSRNSGRLELFHLWRWAGCQAAGKGKVSGDCGWVFVAGHLCLNWREIWRDSAGCWCLIS